MNLSILLLTHKRPNLFNRCLSSALVDIPKNVEILVNNDSNDIVEVKHPQVSYFYYKNSDLSKVYKHLFDLSTKDYIYYLEDDDVLSKLFYKYIDLSYDLNFLNYTPVDMHDFKAKFKIETTNDLFQLSQIIFKKDLLTNFPTGNYRDNDWYLFQTVLKNAKTINLIKQRLFRQTTDGNDNISFGDNKWELNPNCKGKI